MITYIINTQNGVSIYKKNRIISKKQSSLSYVKTLCYDHLFSLEGYLEAVKKVVKLKYKIPIYLSDYLILIPTKSIKNYDNIWINYQAIKNFINLGESIVLCFFDNSQLQIKMTFKAFKDYISKIEKIRIAKVKHFHQQ